jgi:hypothetical protein
MEINQKSWLIYTALAIAIRLTGENEYRRPFHFHPNVASFAYSCPIFAAKWHPPLPIFELV